MHRGRPGHPCLRIRRVDILQGFWQKNTGPGFFHSHPGDPHDSSVRRATAVLESRYQNSSAGKGIRTLELLRDWTLNPAPLTWLGNPRVYRCRWQGNYICSLTAPPLHHPPRHPATFQPAPPSPSRKRDPDLRLPAPGQPGERYQPGVTRQVAWDLNAPGPLPEPLNPSGGFFLFVSTEVCEQVAHLGVRGSLARLTIAESGRGDWFSS
jgi:hypothetical protein